MYLGSEKIKKLIQEKQLVSHFGIGLDKQLQPDGIDLTVAEIYQFKNTGAIYCDTKDLPMTHQCKKYMYNTNIFSLPAGEYQFLFNEVIKLPQNISALTIQRSTFSRCGTISHVGTWDPGYHGRGTHTFFTGAHGLEIERNSPAVKMHFIPVHGKTFEYNGNYQGENIQ